MVKRVLNTVLIAACIFITACTAAQHQENITHNAISENSGETRDKIRSLEAALIALDQSSDREEARQVAQTAVNSSLYLAQEYDIVQPAWFHNLLIQMGLRERGLCWHWTADLMSRLQALKLETYQLRWGVAHRGSDLREHNSVVITANGQIFEKGMILDPWRYSGDLYWVIVAKDSYPWQELPRQEW